VQQTAGERMTRTDLDSTRRFSDRVDDYVAYRPGYPDGVMATLRTDAALSPNDVIADVGSGTGISAEMFLRNGNTVYGVEPNPEMRGAAEVLLRRYPQFHSVDGTAEATTWPSRSVDFVVAGQAFHWFDVPRSRTEFARILKPDGWLVLFWNVRKTGATPFLREYETLLDTFGTDYAQVKQRDVDEATLVQLFGADGLRYCAHENEQVFDFAALKGRLLSSSYAPAEGHPRHQATMMELERIFRAHQQNGRVCFLYDTVMYFGPLARS
jgi:SAM-dependent methyltransferase